MEDIKKKVYKEFNATDLAEDMEMEPFPGKRPILFVSDFTFAPPTDVWETDEKIVVIMEMANLTLKDFSIRYRDGYLIMEGERKAVQENSPEKIIKYYKKEIDSGKFRVKIKMNVRIMREKIQASYENGLLTVYLPKIPNTGPAGNQDKPIPVKSESVTDGQKTGKKVRKN